MTHDYYVHYFDKRLWHKLNSYVFKYIENESLKGKFLVHERANIN